MKGGQTKSDSIQTGNKLKSKGAGAGKRAKKAAKDPNKPKRPPSAFFVFMEGFRKQYKEDNPDNKSVAVEKAPYVQKAEKRKTEYNKNIQAGGGGNNDESDKSKSEINDDDVQSGENEDED
ncbi:HMG1/2-like protein isoform X4 [Hibiscus syriacus]|uniref:HMG1/2-like protein isoform X4 n=1 Tax=Hibiscus syriacus TaxID=106335 RepID=UPI001922B46E|nr:HMG1/2-like protein isoform X4 [Hibiscus syriacus]